jgi:2,4-dienoyl-CoA reductase-like NADH-dependent reductase (Old Yellow Enzyme family)
MGRVTAEVFHGIHPVGASALAAAGHSSDYDRNKMNYVTPRALRTEEIAAVVEDYRLAALNAKEAGFDGIEIHSANGYLLDTFLQSCSNLRTDQYGGSFENRFRIVEEVVEAVLTVFPSSRVAIRLSPNGTYNSMGSADNFEAFHYYINRLNKYNLGYLHLMDGKGWGFHGLCRHYTLAEARKVFDRPIMGNAGYEKLTAEGAINSGAAELISFGRAWISNPDLVERYKQDQPLAPAANRDVWWMYPSFPDGEPSVGYTDFPFYSPN